ncbi:MAG TPA: tetratricopeptide repeat protein [Candidatus Acidoferrum sp.]|nr:tetratricopeptide repeat protein [Candidatus Acidoferrum sp.]
MAKPMLVTVPFVLLLLDYWPLGRFASLGSQVSSLESKVSGLGSREHATRNTQPAPGITHHARKSYIVNRIFLEKVPFLVLAVVTSAATFLIQRRVGAMDTLASVGFGDRLANALVSYMRYMGKMVWPARLAVFYPHPLTLPAWEWATAAVALAGITVVALWLARSRPYVLAGWLWFVGTLVPVIGLVQVGEQAIADRYTYIALIGLFIILVWGAFDLGVHWRWGVRAAAAAGAVVIVALGVQTHRQATYWRTGATLFAHAIAVTENNAVAHNNLGTALADGGDWAEAGKQFAEALRLRPGLQMARINCALALAHQGRTQEASREIANVTQAVGAAGHRVLGDVFRDEGKVAEAIQQYEAAVRLEPTDSQARESLGLLLARQGKPAEAGAQFAELVRIKPDAQTQYYLALSLAMQGKAGQAAEHYREAIRLKPDWPEPLNDLAWMLATSSRAEVRNGAEAVRLAERACELTGRKEARYLGTLDAAYAEAGRFAEAITVAQEARSLALSAGDRELADLATARLQLYRTGKPYHQER